MADKIILVGLPGSGKSTFGKLLSQCLSIPFFDVDEEVERNEGLEIRQIFEDKGEGYFRKTEGEVLDQLLKQPGAFVIASGGGTPCFFNGIDKMNEAGITVYLQLPIDQIIQRISSGRENKRPLLADSDIEKQLSKLLEERKDVYNKAKITINPLEIGPLQLRNLLQT
jgi:shikimate kinase